jgi:cold shock CspA family protein
MTGTVLFYNHEKGWGFFDTEEGDIFFHANQVTKRTKIHIGQVAEFETGPGRDNRPMAVNIRFVAPAATPINNGGQR